MLREWRQFYHVIYLAVMMSTKVMGKDNFTTCDQLVCENEAYCIMTLVNSSISTSVSRASCRCSGRFSGPRCEHEVNLVYHSVTSKNANLEITLGSADTKNIITNIAELGRASTFTLMYWSNDSLGTSCSLAPNVRLGEYTLSNLQSNTMYTICAMSGVLEWCSFIDRNVTLPSNCVEILTLLETQDEVSMSHILPIVLCTVFLLALCIIVGVLVRQRKHIHCLKTYQPIQSSYRRPPAIIINKPDRKRGKLKNDSAGIEYLLPPKAPPSGPVEIHPPSSPDRPNHKLADSIRSQTSTFSVVNDKTTPLTTVLESVPEDNQTEATEESILVVHRSQDS